MMVHLSPRVYILNTIVTNQLYTRPKFKFYVSKNVIIYRHYI